MEWTITLNEKDRYAEVITSGIVDREGSMRMIQSIASAMADKDFKKVLIDHTNIDSVSGEIVDAYYRPKQLSEIRLVPGIKVAVVIKPDYREFFSFLETVFVNCGFLFSIHEDKKSALEWLL